MKGSGRVTVLALRRPRRPPRSGRLSACGEHAVTQQRPLLISEALRERSSYLLGSFLLLVSTLLSLAVPWTLKVAVEALERDRSTPSPTPSR